jgi:hypothetical protein
MKWNYGSCRIEALKYSTKNELRNKNQGCYKAARKNGFLDQICYHMISGKLKWDKNKVIEAAKEFKNRIVENLLQKTFQTLTCRRKSL